MNNFVFGVNGGVAITLEVTAKAQTSEYVNVYTVMHGNHPVAYELPLDHAMRLVERYMRILGEKADELAGYEDEGDE